MPDFCAPLRALLALVLRIADFLVGLVNRLLGRLKVSFRLPDSSSLVAGAKRGLGLCRFRPGLRLHERLARYSLRRRLAASLVGLSLASCATFGLCTYISYEITISHILRWHLEPTLRMLVRADERGESPAGLHALAKQLRVSWFTDEEIPEDLRPQEPGQELVRIKRDRYALVSVDKHGRLHAVVGKVKDLDDIEEIMFKVTLACAGTSLLAALLLAFWLSRRLVTPLVSLTSGIRAGRPLEDSPLCARQDEVGELARAFVAREQSLRAFLVREQLFTGDVSHELRTPLTVLQGASEILESRLAGSPLLPVVERMQRTIDTMTGTVRTMLLLARTPEQLENRTFDMSALARQERERVLELLEDRPIEYVEDLPQTLMIRANPDLAALVLHNLVDNACRYTREGRIHLHLDEHGLVLTDTAPPIDPEVRKRMFERGVRGTGKVPGSGLGLSLVQRSCERIGWSVSHEPWEQGNRFLVRFAPAAHAPAAPDSPDTERR